MARRRMALPGLAPDRAMRPSAVSAVFSVFCLLSFPVFFPFPWPLLPCLFFFVSVSVFGPAQISFSFFPLSPFPFFLPSLSIPSPSFFPWGGGRVNLSLSLALFSMLSLSAQSLASRSFVLSEKFVKAPSTMILRDKTRA